MSEHQSSGGSIDEDEQRVIRLFRCIDHNARSEILQSLGNRLLMEAAVDPGLNLYKRPEQAAGEELHEEIDERLKRLRPIGGVLVDLYNYEQEAGISIAEVIFGSGKEDDEFAEMLVEAYLEGANKHDVPLPCDFAEPEVIQEAAAEEMRQDLHYEALRFIKGWRENVIRQFEQGP